MPPEDLGGSLLVAIAGTRVEATVMDGIAAGDATRPDDAVAASRARAGSTGLLSQIAISLVPQRTITPVLGSDGCYHVLYELQLTNTLGSRSILRSVRMIDAASGRTLLSLGAAAIINGDYLHTLDRQIATTTRETTSFAPFEARVLILNLSFTSSNSIPLQVTHHFEVAGVDPFDQRRKSFDYRGGVVSVSRSQPPVLMPPLSGQGWLASDGCCGPTGHVSALLGLDGRLQAAERFAIDWIKIDASGRIFNGSKTNPRNWVGYGATVQAVGSGVVTTATDNQPDQTPGTMPTLPLAKAPGNHVSSSRMAGGVTAVYAHFKPGSVRVRVGDKVRTGEVIGQLGNSGASLAPHLHFHIVNGPNVITSDGFPYVINTFRLAAIGNIAMLGEALQGKAAFPRRDQMRPVSRQLQLPLGFTIVDFAAGQ